MAAESLTINGMDESQFLKAYNHEESTMAEVGLEWSDLVNMYNYYKERVRPKLEIVASSVYQELRKLDGAYIVTYRTKDPEHVVNKAVRKKKDDNIVVTSQDFIDVFDDLVGLRILHHFKNDWKPIYEQLTTLFDYNEKPIAYYREGDSKELIKQYEDAGLNPVVKPAGYRSIHYIAKVHQFSQEYRCEIQIRTEFEDAWSEIDHIVRYPNELDNPLYNRYLLMFNTLASSADDMGTFLMYMKNHLSNIESEKETLTKTIDELREEVTKLKSEKANSLLSMIDSSLGIYRSSINDFAYPPTIDILKRMQNPSGSTQSDIDLLGFPQSYEDYMRNLQEKKSNSSAADDVFKMPGLKGIYSLWGMTRKDKDGGDDNKQE